MTPQERFVAEAACSRLINLYVTLNDTGRWHELADLFTEDGVMMRPSHPDVPVVGRAAILASFLARPPRITRHICSNIVVTIDGPASAEASSAILLFTGTASDDGALPRLDGPVPLVGSYQDRLSFTEQHGWRFVERRGALSFRAA